MGPSAVDFDNTVKKVSCTHCQEQCEEVIVDSGNTFCCNGCRTVYEILSQKNLCDYYNIDQRAGIKSLRNKANKQFGYLDSEEVQKKLLDFKSEDKAQITFKLPDIHCISCVWLLERLPKIEEGVLYCKTNFLEKSLTVQYDPRETDLKSISIKLSQLGYSPELISEDYDRKMGGLLSRKKIVYQIGIAGFCFGNIMLFSFPDYLGLKREQFALMSEIFRWISLLLALPVLLYSAKDYYISAYIGLRNKKVNVDFPLCLGLSMLFLRSLWEILTGSGPGYLDSFVGLVFFLLIGKWFQQRTWNFLSFERDYSSYFPVSATVLRNGKEEVLLLEKIQVGDEILVRNQEIIPSDGILKSNNALIDYSFVTGESSAITINKNEKLFAGGKLLGQSIEVKVTKSVSNSYLTKLWNEDIFKKEKGRVSILSDQAGVVFTSLILICGLTSLLYWIPRDMNIAVNAFTAVMIVACPCMIMLSVPYTLGNVLRILSKHNFYLKNSTVLENFAEVNEIVFDKTGTLTKKDHELNLSRNLKIGSYEKSLIYSLVRQSNHPLSRKISEELKGAEVLEINQFEEKVGKGISGFVDGVFVQIGSAEWLRISEKTSGVHIVIEDKYIGCFEYSSVLREGIESVFSYFKSAKNRIWLLSGDVRNSIDVFSRFFENEKHLFFEKSPKEKLDFIKSIQSSGSKVAMIGDGLNDAGALQQSDLGIVISEDTNNFSPGCDAILKATSFSKIPQFFKFAKSGVKIVYLSYMVSFFYNGIGLYFAMSGSLSPMIAAVLMPISSVSVVFFGIFLSNLSARRLNL
jgi:P-type Cu+ transporter